MSSPATVIFSVDPTIVILAAAAIRAAQAVQAGYQEAAALREQHAAQRTTHLAAQAEASAAGRAALAEQLQQAQARYAQLTQLAQPFGATAALRATCPPAPAVQTTQALVAYIEQLRALSRTLEDALREALGNENIPGLDDIALPTIAETVLDAEVPATLAIVSSPIASVRLLARLAALGPLPENIIALADALSACQQASRAQLLEIELRRAIQQFETQAAQEASALVLEQTLKDLGYQVEPIAETLFVEGGVMHFRRPGWNNYLIRLRLDSKQATVNFNVIRAVSPGENERSVLDHLAEDRWCTEFPALLKALDARGLHLEVSREVQPGELPVQLVEHSQLPQFAETETQTQAPALQQRERP